MTILSPRQYQDLLRTIDSLQWENGTLLTENKRIEKTDKAKLRKQLLELQDKLYDAYTIIKEITE